MESANGSFADRLVPYLQCPLLRPFLPLSAVRSYDRKWGVNRMAALLANLAKITLSVIGPIAAGLKRAPCVDGSPLVRV